MSLIAELRRRSVFKVGAAYLVVAWIVVQAASIALPAFDAPPGFLRGFILLVMLGFPLALVLAWAFELTPDGVKVDTAGAGRTRILIGSAALVALALGWYFVGQPAYRSGDVADRDPKSIAVLPFVNMSNDPEQEYFSDGIAEELLNRLAQSPELKVAARTSAFQFKGKTLDVAEIARQLKVAHVLEGSVRKQGPRLRITAQLIDARTGFHMWSQTYDRDATDVFAVQDEIAAAIANALESRLNSGSAAVGADAGSAATAKPAPTVDPAAYDEYLQARALVAQRVNGATWRAVQGFERAIAISPDFAAAHSGRGFALTLSAFWAPQPGLTTAQLFAMANTEVGKAIALDPDLAEAYLVRGVLGLGALRIAPARADMDRALALAPGSVDVLNFYGDMLNFLGDLRGAERMKRKAIAVDPLSFIHPANLGQILGQQGRLEESLQMAQRAVTLGKANGARSLHALAIDARLRLGDLDGAAKEIDAFCKDGEDGPLRCISIRAMLHAARGDRAGAAKIVAEIEQRVAKGEVVQLQNLQGDAMFAALHVYATGEPKRAAVELRRSLGEPQWFAYQTLLAMQGAQLPEEISQDPEWLAAWDDPRFAEYIAAWRSNIKAFRAGN